MNIKKLNKNLQKLIESEPDIGPALINNNTDTFHDEIYLGTEDGKYGIYKELNDRIRRDGTPVWTMTRISRKLFDSEREAKEWLAKYLLNNDRKETIENYIKNGVVIIYDNDLKSILGLENVQPGKRVPEPSLGVFSRASVGRSANPVPSYVLMPKGPQRNNARIDYIRLHGKPYENENFKNNQQLNKKLKQLVEELKIPGLIKTFLDYNEANATYDFDLLNVQQDPKTGAWDIQLGVKPQINNKKEQSFVIYVKLGLSEDNGLVWRTENNTEESPVIVAAPYQAGLGGRKRLKPFNDAIQKMLDFKYSE